MLMQSVSEFVEFLSPKDHTIDEVLAHMVLRILRPLDASSAFISQLNNQNEIETLGMFGISSRIKSQYFTQYNLNNHYPITDAIKNRKIVWITSLPNWPEEYPELAKVKHESGEKTFICFPIEKSGTPVAILGIFFKPVINSNAETDSFLKTIGNLFALHLYGNFEGKKTFPNILSTPPKDHNKIDNRALTERQKLILLMISEGRTNLNIGELLGYSESTIRQETIKIYSSLNCHGRKEASKIYKEKYSHD